MIYNYLNLQALKKWYKGVFLGYKRNVKKMMFFQ